MKKLIVLLFAVIVGWVLIGKMPKAEWDKLDPIQQMFMVQIAANKFLENGLCAEAEIRVMGNETEVIFLGQCVKERREADGKSDNISLPRVWQNMPMRQVDTG